MNSLKKYKSSKTWLLQEVNLDMLTVSEDYEVKETDIANFD